MELTTKIPHEKPMKESESEKEPTDGNGLLIWMNFRLLLWISASSDF